MSSLASFSVAGLMTVFKIGAGSGGARGWPGGVCASKRFRISLLCPYDLSIGRSYLNMAKAKVRH